MSVVSFDAATSGADLNAALERLLRKYDVAPDLPWRLERRCEAFERGRGPDDDALLLVPGSLATGAALSERLVPLLPWRSERRFVELRGLVAQRTIAPVLMGRLACHADANRMPLEAILCREFDLAEWLIGSPIVSLYASLHQRRAANVILRLADGTICSVEASAVLPPGAALQDRHELIARRGVASDRAVDTQVAQASVYVRNAAGQTQCTDVDFELFGLDAGDASLVRAAYEALGRPDARSALRRTHRRLCRLVDLAIESDQRGERLRMATDEGGNP